ncbi:glycosyltransferase family 39 protein [Nostoc parmelioides]|uniref:Glycosyltransferase family 39 protein n=1 Tax=Nostoc parmelioides FACHB-3921 TaxID=2692909 RepID=A0ABR8BJU5_9NOSO|nr:glycosyltransferase family 39 protein [Nostoc parmelioides]MBD2254146.1 glycosyltransferase family 39 protein [Nostoc parmelioides FACHB-3921]
MKKSTVFISILLLTVGILFRFVNVEQKPYWGDEVDSLSWISGRADFKDLAFRGQEMSVREVLSYQSPYPGTNLIDTYQIIYYEHAPIFYLLARLWMGFQSSDLMTARSLAGVISLLVFPCIYWLCVELFQSSVVGWMAMTLVAVSPFHLLYAQEARQYTLWISLILLTSLTLLRAMRFQTIWSWILYIVTLTLMLYTHLLSVIVILTYSIYIFLQEGFRLSKTLVAYLISSVISFLLFTPWLLVVAANVNFHKDQSPSWTKEPTSVVVLIKTWMLNFSRLFWDFNQTFESTNLFFYLLNLSLIIYAIYHLKGHSQQRTWLFLGLMIIIPFILLATPDIILGGRRSTPIRYFIPACLAIEIVAAYLISSKIILAKSKQDWRQKFWQITTFTIIAVGILSCGLITHENTWWSKQREYYHSEVAAVVNQAKKPLVIANWFDIRTLAHSFSPHVTLQEIRLLKDVKSVGKDFSNVFLYQNQGNLERLLETQTDLQIKEKYIWYRQTSPVNSTRTILWELVRK